ncbi:MAG TPA: DUF1552 domain-containing protein [Polyangia bacterium]|nr:DUF1552 domain-containing protein [Polyangia bacterium]
MKLDAHLRLTRRAVLGGMSAGLAHTFLRPLIAEAQGLIPQRFFMIHRPCGTWPDDFLPPKTQPSSADYPITPILKSFEMLRKKMVVFRGVDAPPNNTQNGDRHGAGLIGQVTGRLCVQPANASVDDRNDSNSKTITAATPSFDQYILQNGIAGVQPAGAGAKSIHLSGNTRSGPGVHFACLAAISYAGTSQPKFGEPRPMKNYTNILGSAMVGGPGTVDPAVLERQLQQKKSVLDFVRSDLGRLKAQVPSSQNVKLDSHLEGIRLLESRITKTPPPMTAGCSKPTLLPEPLTSLTGRERDEVIHKIVCANNLAIIRAAFQCDLTRVASFTFADGNNDLHPINYVANPTFKITGNHHDAVSHGGKQNPDAQLAKKQTDIFYGDLTAKVLMDMDKVPEGAPGQTLLDNTLTYYMSECSYGDDHEMIDLCTLFFGGQFLKLNVGNFFNYQPKIYMNDVWTSILNAWGKPTDQFGEPMYCKGRGPGAAKGLIIGT